MEHIPEPGEFIQSLARATETRNPVFFFEVPNIFWSLERDAFWDIYYEHCLYFGYHSLVNLFTLNGFECLAAGDGFGGQYVWVDARHRPPVKENIVLPPVPQLLITQVDDFAKRYQTLITQWQQRINEIIASGKTKLVLWGAGARAVTFLNLTGFTSEQIEYVVDINPAKHGLYIPGTGQQIVSPQFLAEYGPDTVIGTNPAYQDEIWTLMRQANISGNFIIISV